MPAECDSEGRNYLEASEVVGLQRAVGLRQCTPAMVEVVPVVVAVVVVMVAVV